MRGNQIPQDRDNDGPEDDADDALWSETHVTEAIHEANQNGIDPAEYVRHRGHLQSNAPYAFRTIYRKEKRRNFSAWFRRWWRGGRDRPG